MSKVLRALSPWVVVVVSAGWIAGCGGHSTSPTAPSSSTPSSPSASPAPSPAPAGPSATITGTVALGSGAASGVSVGVAGTTLASTSDGGGNFAIASVPPSDVVLTFSAPGVSASAPVGSVAANDALHVDVTISGAAATVNAQQKTAPDNSVTADGTISDLDKASQVFRLGSTVVAGASASVTRSGTSATFADLANGDHVNVRGMKDGNGVRASQIDAQPVAPSNPGPTEPAPDVTLNGTIAGLSGSCPALTMTVAGGAVKTTGSTSFSNRACGELRNGDTVYAVGPKQSDGSVLASKIYYVQPPDPTVTLTGTASGVGGTCPAMTLTVQGTSVKTTSATTFDGSKGCTGLANGDALTVVGTKQSDGSVVASKVTNATTPPAEDVTYNGPIAALGGSCPVLSMTVDGKAVKTNASTVFTNKTCVELKNGDTVYAIGPKQSDGSVLASKIYYSNTTPNVTITGSVSGVNGTCPAIAMTVAGTAVKATSTTTFDGTKGCTGLASGDSVTVVGTKQSDGTLLATKITNATAPPPTDVYVNGPIVGLAGTCPAIAFSLSGTAVKTSSATTFNGRSCAELKNGDVIYAAGPKQADGSILATRTFYTPPTVTLTGTVSNLGGTWPVLTLTVQGMAVKTSSATTCDGTKGCSLMANGDSVTVVGTQQSDGTLLATKITNATAPPATVTLTGTVSNFSGSTGCPVVTLTVQGKAVKASSATTFDGTKGCTGMVNGDSVTVVGITQNDGSVVASKITNASNPPLYGAIAGLAGTCPAVSMTVAGTPVRTTSATTFSSGACTDLKNGGNVYVFGAKQGDGTLLASQIYFPKS